ncbi:hypothetical protein POX_f07747 [Penicillium oxalicum]|uniref:hypothetical protein n=1 Tax=Penicillium oxalicum TaxID=69781 RepID=UPI0020B6BB07|nr:hypothetical protein POX_f07747 [Penicillium oxalicum]KAI2787383.1 hypothetical protein POX_f07747 [Penicillium oxalicum]
MTQLIDLGNVVAQDARSEIQMTVKAFVELLSNSNQAALIPPTKISHWRDLQLLWTREAPELELRLFVEFGLEFEENQNHTLRAVTESVSSSKVFPSLGFTTVIKNCQRLHMMPRTYQIIFGLCRENRQFTSPTNRSLPMALKHASEARVPDKISCVCIKSIDLRIYYSKSDAVRPPKHDIQKVDDFCLGKIGPKWCSYQGEVEPSNNEEEYDTRETSDMADVSVSSNCGASHKKSNELPLKRQMNLNTNDSDLPRLLELLEFGLWAVFLPEARKSQHIHADSKEKIQNLSFLIPAVFNLKYRQVISRSLVPMLERSKNHSIQQKLASLIGREEQTLGQSQKERLSSALNSSLWTMAQLGISRKKNNSNTTGATSLSKRVPEKRYLQSDDDIIFPASSEPFLPDSETFTITDPACRVPCLENSTTFHELLSEGSSMLGGGDCCSPGQTNMTTQAVQDLADNFSLASDCLLCDWSDLPEPSVSDSMLTDEPLDYYAILEETDSRSTSATDDTAYFEDQLWSKQLDQLPSNFLSGHGEFDEMLCEVEAQTAGVE